MNQQNDIWAVSTEDQSAKLTLPVFTESANDAFKQQGSKHIHHTSSGYSSGYTLHTRIKSTSKASLTQTNCPIDCFEVKQNF